MTGQPTTTSSVLLPSPTANRAVLDEAKRQRILAILTCGGSRRMAARYVGCSGGTITRTAARDPPFAEQLAHAEANLEIESLRAIRNALKQDRYWRAAAWVPEKKHSRGFSAQRPRGFTTAEVFEMVAQILASLGPRISDEDRRGAMETLGSLIQECDPSPSRTGRSLVPSTQGKTG